MNNKNSLITNIVDSSVNSLPMPKILVLDLDLTLHNVITHYDDSLNETLAHFGCSHLTEEGLAKVNDNFTNTKSLLAEFLPKTSVEQAFEYYINHFLAREIPVNSLIPGAKDLLDQVKNKLNIPIIGITNSVELIATKILNDLDILKFFDHVIGFKEDHLPKPNTQMLLKALAKISAVPGSHVWFVGDRHSDTECAKRAGCTAVRFYHKKKPVDENADLFINCHYDLFSLMRNKCGNIF